jgi:hypothetical protein
VNLEASHNSGKPPVLKAGEENVTALLLLLNKLAAALASEDKQKQSRPAGAGAWN